jgi:hypothetical protein
MFVVRAGGGGPFGSAAGARLGAHTSAQDQGSTFCRLCRSQSRRPADRPRSACMHPAAAHSFSGCDAVLFCASSGCLVWTSDLIIWADRCRRLWSCVCVVGRVLACPSGLAGFRASRRTWKRFRLYRNQIIITAEDLRKEKRDARLSR